MNFWAIEVFFENVNKACLLPKWRKYPAVRCQKSLESMPKEGVTCCDGFFWMRYIFFKSDWLSLPERLPSLFALLSHFPWWGRTQERRRRMNKLKSLKKKVWDTSKRVRLLKRGREKKYISSMSLMLCRPRFRGTGHNTVYSQMQRMLTNLSLLPQSWR